jgi:integrase
MLPLMGLRVTCLPTLGLDNFRLQRSVASFRTTGSAASILCCNRQARAPGRCDYRAGGLPKKLTLGSYPAIDLATARKRAMEALGEIAAGKDPAAIKMASRAAAKAERVADVDLVERVVELFVDRHAKPNTSDWRETERMLVKEVVGRWAGRRLSQITRAHIHEMLDEIVDRGAPIRANRVFAQFRKMCRWAISRGIIERSPCEGMTAPSPETRRDRVLSTAEIRLAWRALDSMGWPFGAIGQLLLFTGARRDEVAGMKWNELDLADRVWSLPRDRTKNKRDHQIPLSAATVRIIEHLSHIHSTSATSYPTRHIYRPRRSAPTFC